MKPRVFVASRRDRNQPVGTFLARRLGVSAGAAAAMLRQRRVTLNGSPCIDPGRRLSPGQVLRVSAGPPGEEKGKKRKEKAARAPRETGERKKEKEEKRAPQHRIQSAGPRPVIRHADEHIVIVDKPAGLTTMRHEEEAAEFGERGRRFLPATLQDLLPALLTGPRGVFAIHRLDRDTSGLVVFARTPAASSHLGKQFRAHTIERCYLALVRGKARGGLIESFLVRDRGDGRRGSGTKPGEGARAVTHVEVVEELGDYTLVQCRLETGRTHQVRIHLAEAGTPLCGERVYDRPLNGRPLPDGSGAKRVALHAATLGFTHPATGKRVLCNSPLPADMTHLLDEMRRRTD